LLQAAGMRMPSGMRQAGRDGPPGRGGTGGGRSGGGRYELESSASGAIQAASPAASAAAPS
jgi:hypothetical protein